MDAAAHRHVKIRSVGHAILFQRVMAGKKKTPPHTQSYYTASPELRAARHYTQGLYHHHKTMIGI
jgi:hypothetical protein